jgi:hypothetical protein
MASTYSPNLGIELIGTGDQSGTWGATTNTNMGTLIEQAVVGYSTQAVTDSGVATVLSITSGSSSTGRNYVIEFMGALTAARTVTVPAVNKPYVFFNNTTGGFAVTVKVSGQTGVTIANGKKAIVYTNTTDVIEVANAPVTEAGTQTLTNKTLTSPTLTTPTVALVKSSTSFTVQTGGTATALTIDTSQNATFVGDVAANVLKPTTALGATYGGTAQSSYTIGDILYASGTSTLTKLAAGGNGTVLTIASGIPSWATSSVGVSSFQTSLSGLTPSTATTGVVTLAGTLGASSGGTGLVSYTIGDLVYASATTTLSKLAGVAVGSVLVSGGVGTAPAYSAAPTLTSLTTTTTTSATLVGTHNAYGNIIALTDGTTIAVDMSVTGGNNFSVTLGGNRTLGNPTGLTAGQSGIVYVSQDATGSRTLAYGSYWKFPSGTAPTLTTTASATDALVYTVRTATSITVTSILNIG